MGTCKIVMWCESPQCVDGCLAQKAVNNAYDRAAEMCLARISASESRADRMNDGSYHWAAITAMNQEARACADDILTLKVQLPNLFVREDKP